MKVWLVYQTRDYYVDELYGIFTTEELAKQCRAHAMRYEGDTEYWYRIDECDVDREFTEKWRKGR